jgi:hypothetical protein
VTSRTEEVTTPADLWSGLPSPLEAVEDMRTTAKWIIGAAAAVGVVLLGGAPLAAVGKVHGVGSAVEAYVGLVIGLAGVGWAIWQTSEALIPPATTLSTLETPELAGLRAQIAADPAAFYGSFGTSVADLQAASRLFDTAAARVAIMLAAELDPTRQRILTQGMADASANATQARGRLRWLLALTHAWRVQNLLRRARLHAFAGAAAAALGAVLFVTATTTNSSTATPRRPAAPASTTPTTTPTSRSASSQSSAPKRFSNSTTVWPLSE